MAQDLPPTGGYEPVQYKRNLPARGFRPGYYLFGVFAIMTYGWYKYVKGVRELKYVSSHQHLCAPPLLGIACNIKGERGSAVADMYGNKQRTGARENVVTDISDTITASRGGPGSSEAVLGGSGQGAGVVGQEDKGLS
ncbi:MAG: hypothetical protein Q9181_001415 [Wetmoreana brouardii]